MKLFYAIVLLFLVSCSAKQNEVFTEENTEQERTYFEQIFTDSEPIFNGYELGDGLSEDVVININLSKLDSFTSTIKVVENKINAVELEIYIETEEGTKTLIESIVDKYNTQLNYTKAPSSFVTWSYVTKDNFPVEIILIYEEELKTISLDIGYKSQR